MVWSSGPFKKLKSCSVLSRTAFPFWLLTNVLFCVVVRYGAGFLIGTGLCQLLAVGVWFWVRNFIELSVPFEGEKGEEVEIVTRFGPDFYLVMANGILCFGLGLAIFAANALWPDQMCALFGIDPLTLYDEHHLSTSTTSFLVLKIFP
jgi:dual oxidase maturation factor 2/dual oxidase maturation factor 1